MSALVNRISNKISRLYIDALFLTNLDKLVLKNQAGKLRIIMYHGIDKSGSLKFNNRFVSENCFEKQMKYFRANCNVISVMDAFEKKNYSSDKLNVAITFDDGYKNNLHLGLPILEKYNVPATFFITSIKKTEYDILWADYIDIATFSPMDPVYINNRKFEKINGSYLDKSSGISLKKYLKQNDFAIKKEAMKVFEKEIKFLQDDSQNKVYWELLENDEIEQLSMGKNVTIGAHGHLHNNLDQISIDNARDEMKICKEYLESIVNQKIEIIAFPDGAYNQAVKQTALKLGYKHMMAVDYHLVTDAQDDSILNRIGLYSYQSCRHQIYTAITHTL